MVLAFCNSPHNPLSVYQDLLNYLQQFKRYTLDKSVMDRRMDSGRLGRLTKWQLHALPLLGIKIKIQLIR